MRPRWLWPPCVAALPDYLDLTVVRDATSSGSFPSAARSKPADKWHSCQGKRCRSAVSLLITGTSAAARPARRPSRCCPIPGCGRVWSGWAGGQRIGFGRASLLPGIWPSFHLDTTLPVGLEAQAATPRAWSASDGQVSAPHSPIRQVVSDCLFAHRMTGQLTYRLLA